MKKYFLGMLFGLMAVIAVFTVDDARVLAAAGIEKLNVKGSYFFDITGDGMADSVGFSTTDGEYYSTRLYIYVNGNVAYSITDRYFYSVDIKKITLANGSIFLYVFCLEDNDDGPCRILQYRDGQMVCIEDFETFWGKYKYGMHAGAELRKVRGNRVTVRARLMSWNLAGIRADFVYQYQGGTLERASDEAKLRWDIRKHKALKRIVIYKSRSKKSQKIVIRKGQSVTFPRVWLRNGKLWYQVRLQNGEKGWLFARKRAYRNGRPPFDGMGYAG